MFPALQCGLGFQENQFTRSKLDSGMVHDVACWRLCGSCPNSRIRKVQSGLCVQKVFETRDCRFLEEQHERSLSTGESIRTKLSRHSISSSLSPAKKSPRHGKLFVRTRIGKWFCLIRV